MKRTTHYLLLLLYSQKVKRNKELELAAGILRPHNHKHHPSQTTTTAKQRYPTPLSLRWLAAAATAGYNHTNEVQPHYSIRPPAFVPTYIAYLHIYLHIISNQTKPYQIEPSTGLASRLPPPLLSI